MSKIIIHNQTELPDADILRRVLAVVDGGKVSETGAGEQYCFSSGFADGVNVSCRRGYGTETQTFYVWRRGDRAAQS